MLENRVVLSTFSVTTELDTVDANDGLYSLREAISGATSGDQITFDQSLSGSTINLNLGQLFINKDLNILGPGANNLAISGQGRSRVFEISEGTRSSISGLTIENGRAPSGGGLYNLGSLIVSDSVFSGNATSSVQTGFGGAIYNDGNLTVRNSTLTLNRALYGAGIFNDGVLVDAPHDGVLTVSNCILFQNTTSGGAAGGIYNAGTATLDGSTLSANVASSSGGVLNEGTMTITDCTFSTNSAIHGGYGGGATNIGTLTILTSTWTGNSAAGFGGGIENDGALTISGSTLTGNSALYGGGIDNHSDGTVTLRDNSSVYGNIAPSGADVLNDGVLHLDDSSSIVRLGGSGVTLPLASTTTTITSSSNPSPAGNSVTFTATVKNVVPGAGTPMGLVSFLLDGIVPLGSATLNGSGQAAITVGTLSVGNHVITASFAGYSYFASGISPAFDQAAVANAVTATVTSSANPLILGQPVTFTATIEDAAGVAGIPTGGVTFLVDGSPLGVATLDSSGRATITTTGLSTGTHAITVAYSGDANFEAGVSATFTQTVQAAASTKTTLISSNPNLVLGQEVTFTATVATANGDTGTPKGAVTFFLDGTTPLGTGMLDSSGSARFTTAGLPMGNHTITASYAGVGAFAASTSAAIAQSVLGAASTIAVASSDSPVMLGEPVTFTATVSATAGAVPEGMVTFLVDGTALGSGTLNASGQATITTSALSVGEHTIMALYSGDASFVGSSSQALNQEILSAQQAAAEIVDQVMALVAARILDSGSGNALTVKLDNAIASLNGGNTTAGINQLKAFLNQINALVKSHRLSDAEAQTLISAIEATIAGVSAQAH